MKNVLLVLLAMLVSPSADLLNYADNAILSAAEDGYKGVRLVFGRADVDTVQAVANDLRRRGYKLDEQAALLNPAVITVLRLKRPPVTTANIMVIQ